MCYFITASFWAYLIWLLWIKNWGYPELPGGRKGYKYGRINKFCFACASVIRMLLFLHCASWFSVSEEATDWDFFLQNTTQHVVVAIKVVFSKKSIRSKGLFKYRIKRLQCHNKEPRETCRSSSSTKDVRSCALFADLDGLYKKNLQVCFTL